MKTKNPKENALAAALRFLKAGDKSRQELANKLQNKAFDAPIVEDVLDKLQAKGYVNDSSFAERLVEGSLRKCFSKKKIIFALKRRGFPESVIAEQMENLTPEVEQECLDDAGRKQWRRLGRLDKEERRKKVFAFLARSGFELEMIRSFFERMDAGIEASEDNV